jgi:hypothetical protein
MGILGYFFVKLTPALEGPATLPSWSGSPLVAIEQERN